MATSWRSLRKGRRGNDAGVETGSQDIAAFPVVSEKVSAMQASLMLPKCGLEVSEKDMRCARQLQGNSSFQESLSDRMRVFRIAHEGA